VERLEALQDMLAGRASAWAPFHDASFLARSVIRPEDHRPRAGRLERFELVPWPGGLMISRTFALARARAGVISHWPAAAGGATVLATVLVMAC